MAIKWVPLEPFPFDGTVMFVNGNYYVCEDHILQGYNPTWWANHRTWVSIIVKENRDD